MLLLPFLQSCLLSSAFALLAAVHVAPHFRATLPHLYYVLYLTSCLPSSTFFIAPVSLSAHFSIRGAPVSFPPSLSSPKHRASYRTRYSPCSSSPKQSLPLGSVVAIPLALRRAPCPQRSIFAINLTLHPLSAVPVIPRASCLLSRATSPKLFHPQGSVAAILLFTHSPPCPSSPKLLACYCTHSLARATSPKQFHPQGSVGAIPPALRCARCPQRILLLYLLALYRALHP